MSYDFKKQKTYLNITLYKSNFLNNNEYIGRISNTTINNNNIIAGILEKEPLMDGYMLQRAAALYKRQILEELSLGNDVNIFDLCTAHIALSKSVKGPNPNPKDIPPFEIRFSNLPQSKEPLKRLFVGSVYMGGNVPVIKEVVNIYNNSTNSLLTPGNICSIKGTCLKLGTANSYIQFFQTDSKGEVLESVPPITVDSTQIYKNTPTELFFFIPSSLISGTQYKIRITTSYLKKDINRKTPVSTESEILVAE